jgi:transposase
MAAQIRPVHRDMPMLLPPDLRDWVPEDDMVHFVIEAVEQMPLKLDRFAVNHRGTGSKQYSPRMMLALLVYCYANGIFSSRRIERATYRDVAVRFLTGDSHPDHDTICEFRRRNQVAFAEAFLHVLRLAREMGVLQVGTVSVDGTHLDANASKSKNVRFDRAVALEKQLRLDIEGLLRKAEAADAEETVDGQSLPEEIARRERLLKKMEEAQAKLKARADAKVAAEREAYQRKIEQREAQPSDEPRRGPRPKPPENKGPEPSDQANLTDDDSRLMRKNRRAEYRQAYNAQVVVDADGSQLILAEHVTNCANDANQLEPALQGVDPTVGKPSAVLADCGYVNGDSMERMERKGYDLYLPVTAEAGNNDRRYDYRPPREKPPRVVTDPRLVAMQTKMQGKEARRRYAKRKQTVEPVFGIIKAVMGFRHFRLRGLAGVSLEWMLTTLAYNVKRLYALRSMAVS